MNHQHVPKFGFVLTRPYPIYFLFMALTGLLLAGSQTKLSAQSPTFDSPVPAPFGLDFLGPMTTFPTVRLMDFDQDDTLEALVHYWTFPPFGELHYYENDGSNDAPAFRHIPQLTGTPFGLKEVPLLYSLVDLDGDSLVEAYFWEFALDQPLKMQPNIGTPEMPSFQDTLIFNPYGITIPWSEDSTGMLDSLVPVFVDIDGDGDYDLFLAGRYTNNTGLKDFYYYENQDSSGNGTAPYFPSYVINPFGLSMPEGLRSQHHREAFVDTDCDGDLDLYVNGNPINTIYYENTGTATNPDFSSGWQIPTDSLSAHAGSFVDIGGDGDLDLIGGDGHEIWFLENISPGPIVEFADSINYNTVSFSNLSEGSVDSCFWDFGDGHNSTEKNPVHIYDSLGIYEVCLTAWYRCQSREVCDSVHVLILDSNTDLLDVAFHLSPNPAKDHLVLEVESAESLSQLNIELLDIAGKRISYFDKNIQRNHLLERLDIGELTEGIYVLKISSNGKSLHKKFIKMN